MNLTLVIDGLRDDLQSVADLGDERAAQIAQRLGNVLGAGLRLRVFDLLSQAALEVSSKLPSGHVEVRLAGQEPELVFVDDSPSDSGSFSEDLSARISLRLPESVKAAAEKAAAREGISTNAWLVRAIARATESRGPTHTTGKRLSGYGRS
jgi:HicB family